MYFEEIATFECSTEEVAHFNKLFSGYGFYVNIEHVLRYETDVSSNNDSLDTVSETNVDVIVKITVLNLIKENENE